ncbi:hypothetical protein Hanom_Chr10g00937261 [Helianthus anomalus]
MSIWYRTGVFGTGTHFLVFRYWFGTAHLYYKVHLCKLCQINIQICFFDSKRLKLLLCCRGWERVTVKKVQNSLVILKCIKKISFGLMMKMVPLIKAILRPKRTSFSHFRFCHFRLVPILIQRRNISHIVTSSTKNVFCFRWLIFKDQSL